MGFDEFTNKKITVVKLMKLKIIMIIKEQKLKSK